MNHLPGELVVHILELIDYRDIVRSRLICKFWCTIIDSSLLLRFLVDLGMHGKENAPTNSLTTSQRYEALKAHETSWRDLSPSICENSSTLFLGSLYEFMDGFHAQLTQNLDEPSHSSLSFLQLPSALTNSGPREWTFRVESTVVGFAMDPEQDLLVLIEDTRDGNECWNIHLRTMSTNATHYLAEKGVLLHPDIVDIGELTIGKSVFRVMGDTLGVFMSRAHYAASLVIWQWTTGTIISALRLVLPSTDYCTTFSFLSDHTIVLPRCHNLIDGVSAGAFLEIYDFEAQATTPTYFVGALVPAPVLVAKYHLPSVNYACGVRIRSEPPPRTINRPAGSRRAASTIYHSSARLLAGMWRPPPKPFRPTADDILVHLRLWVRSRRRDVRTVGHVIKNYAIVLYASTLLAYGTVTGTSHPAVFFWPQWGEKRARVFEHRLSYRSCVYGDRFARIFPSADGLGDIVQVLDFNPARNRRTRQSLVSSPWPSAVTMGQASLDEHDLQAAIEAKDPGIFEAFDDGVVASCLPYIESRIGPFTHPVQGVAVGDEHLLVYTDHAQLFAF